MNDRDQWDLDAALSRLFTPPAGLAQRLRSSLGSIEEREAEPELGRGFQFRPLFVLAAAAALAVVFLPRLGEESLPHSGLAGSLGQPQAGLCPEDGFDSVPGSDYRRQTPDLASLYHEALASSGVQTGATDLGGGCATPALGDSLTASLKADLGAALRVDSDANFFAGPFPLAEWRGGTVLAAFPEEGGLPSVLIAESESTVRCCIDLIPPRDPGLHVFAWRIGSILLIEITERTEPSFMESFELL